MRWNRTVLSFGVAASALLGSACQVTSQTAERELAAAIDSIANSALRSRSIPGMSIAVVRGSNTIIMRGYGFADLENDVPATAETVYRIASITKQFTAAAIMRLVEQRKIHLDDPITKFLPEYPAAGRKVTIHHLLNHTSGIPTFAGMAKAREKRRLDLTHEQVLAFFKDEPLEFAPGGKLRFTNSGYYLLGMILEKATSQSYPDHLRQTFFEPLALTSTVYCDQRPIIKHRARGYSFENGTPVNAAPISMKTTFSAAALCSTVEDLVKWQQAMVEGRIVDPATYAKMTRLTELPDGEKEPYGYGLSLADLEGRPRVAHVGAINGFTSYLSYYPEQDVTVAVLANSGSANTWVLGTRIARLVLGIPEPMVKDLPLSAEARTRYIGTYDAGVFKLSIIEEDGRLKIERPQTQLLYQGDHTFVAEDNPDVHVTFRVVGEEATELSIMMASGHTFEAKRVQ